MNKHMLKDLIHGGFWTPEIRNQIMADRGSIQNVAAIPDEMKRLYKTVLGDQSEDSSRSCCRSCCRHLSESVFQCSLPESEHGKTYEYASTPGNEA